MNKDQVDAAFAEFRELLAAHHAIGHSNLGDGMAPGAALDDHGPHVFSGFSSRCEMHENPHVGRRKRLWRQLQAEGLDESSREARWRVKGTVTGLQSATSDACQIRSLAGYRTGYCGTPFYLKPQFNSPQNCEEGDEPKFMAHSEYLVYNGSLFAPIPHLYDVDVEVAEVKRENVQGVEETVVVVRDVFMCRPRYDLLLTKLGTFVGFEQLMSYVLNVSRGQVREILQQAEFVPPDLPAQKVDACTTRDFIISATEQLYEIHQSICRALARYDRLASRGKIDDEYQTECFDIHFGQAASDERVRREKYPDANKFEDLKRAMPPTKLALFCRHPEVLQTFGFGYLEALSGCGEHDGNPMYRLDFLRGLSLTCLRELFWYSLPSPAIGECFWPSKDYDLSRLRMNPTQRLFFHTCFAPRGNAAECDPSHADYIDLRLVSMPHPHSRRRSVLPLEELWMEYMMHIEPEHLRSAEYEPGLFGLCVVIYGIMKQAHYVDKNSCLPSKHVLARLYDLLGLPLTSAADREAVQLYSSRYRLESQKHIKSKAWFAGVARSWFSRAIQNETASFYDLRQFIEFQSLLAVQALCDPAKLGVMIHEYEEAINDSVYYLKPAYMFERTIVHGLQTICRQFEERRKFVVEDGCLDQHGSPLWKRSPLDSERVYDTNWLVSAAMRRQWDRDTIMAISQAVQEHLVALQADAERMHVEERDAMGDEDLLFCIEPHVVSYAPLYSAICQWPERMMQEIQWFYDLHHPESVQDLQRMMHFGPPGGIPPKNFHPACSEQVLGYETLFRYPIQCFTGQAGSGKSDLGMFMFAGAELDNPSCSGLGMTFMSSHCATLQDKMASCGVQYPVCTIHQFMDWHAKTCTNHPHMPPELASKARGLWRYLARQKVPFWGAAAEKSTGPHPCLLAKTLKFIMIDEAGLLYDELLAQLLNILSRCAGLLVSIVFIGDVQQLEPVQPGHPFFQLIGSGVGVLDLKHMHRAEMKKLVQLSRSVLEGDTEASDWNDRESTYHMICSESDRSVKKPMSLISRLMYVMVQLQLEYRDTMIVCHRRDDCHSVSSELDGYYLGKAAFKSGGRDGQLNFQSLALGTSGRIKTKTFLPGQLVLVKKHISQLNLCTNEIMQIYDVVMGSFVRIPYAVLSQMRRDLWDMMVQAVLDPSPSVSKNPELLPVIVEVKALLQAWGDKEPSPGICTPADVIVGALKGHYRALLSSFQREHAVAQCREAWQHWITALEVYKDQPQQVLAAERSRQELGDWPPDGHSFMHWQPASYVQRERREWSQLLPDADCPEPQDEDTGTVLTGDWISLLQGYDVLMEQLVAVAGAETDSIVYKMMCETAVDLLLGLRHDLKTARNGGIVRPLGAMPHINPMVRVNPRGGPSSGRQKSRAETESYVPLDQPDEPFNKWWRCDTCTDDERQLIEQCVPNGRCVSMAVVEHSQWMNERAQDLLHAAVSTSSSRGGDVQAQIPSKYRKYLPGQYSPVDENDYVAFKPLYRTAHSKVKGPDDVDCISFMRCVIRSSYGKLTKNSVVFVPCTESFEYLTFPASAVTPYACQSKQTANTVYTAYYTKQNPSLTKAGLYTTLTRAERRFIAVATEGAIFEAMKHDSPARLSFLASKIAVMRQNVYKSPTGTPVMDEVMQLVRALQHTHLDEADEQGDETKRECFSRDTPLAAPDEPRKFSLGARRDAWLQIAHPTSSSSSS